MKFSRVSLARVFVMLFLFSLICLFNSAFIYSTAKPIKVIINDSELVFGTDANDPLPYIKEGRTLVPFRKIFERLGMEVTWDAKARSVFAKKDSLEMLLYIDKNNALINGVKKNLDVAPEITDGRTFVPLRFVSENFGANVEWDATTRTVTITYSEKAKAVGDSTTFNDIRSNTTVTFTIDKVEEMETEYNKKIKISGKTNYDKTNVLAKLSNNIDQPLLSKTYVLPSDNNLYDFYFYWSVPKSYTSKYILIEIPDGNGEYITLARYDLN